MAAGALGDLARELLAVGTDQARDVIAVGRDALVLEGAQPRLDACLDGVDQGPIEIEDERLGLGQRCEIAQGRPFR